MTIFPKQLRLFRYYNIESPTQEELIAAYSYSDAKLKLLQNNVVPYKLKASLYLNKRCWKTEHLLLMTQQLAMTLRTGLPLLKSLQLLANDHPHLAWRYLLNDLAKHISTGGALYQRLAYHKTVFSDFYCSLVEAGEMTGKLDFCLQQLANQYEQKLALQKKIKKAMRYPIFILSITLLMTTGMLIFILPQFQQMYQNVGADLPALTQFVVNFSNLLQKHILIVILIVILAALFYRNYLRKNPKWQHYQEGVLLHLPIIGKLMQLEQLQQCFCILSVTQQAGIQLLTGLETAQNALTISRYKHILAHLINAIKHGKSFSQSIQKSPFFPVLCYQLIHVGEETGELEQIFQALNAHYMQQTDDQLEKLAKNIEPLLMSFLGILVGGLIISMYLPIFQLGNVIG